MALGHPGLVAAALAYWRRLGEFLDTDDPAFALDPDYLDLIEPAAHRGRARLGGRLGRLTARPVGVGQVVQPVVGSWSGAGTAWWW